MEKQKSIKERLAQWVDTEVKPIVRISRSGGGAKGAGSSGVFDAELETGLHEGVEHEAGASAGAMASGLIACGITSSHFRKLYLNTNFAHLMGDFVADKSKPGVSVLTKDGKPLLELLSANTQESIAVFLKEHQDEVDSHMTLFDIQEKIKGGQDITFRELHTLHARWPETFKDLSVIAVRYPNGEEQIFDYRTTPDVAVVLACRASASLPIILEPVEIEIGEETFLFVDGGYIDNNPVNCFDRDEVTGEFKKNSLPQQTLIYAFGEGTDNSKNQVFQAQFGSRMDEALADNLLSNVLTNTLDNFKAMHSQNAGANPNKLLRASLQVALTKFVGDSVEKYKAGEEMKSAVARFRESEEYHKTPDSKKVAAVAHFSQDLIKNERKLLTNMAKSIEKTADKSLYDLIENKKKYPEVYQELANAKGSSQKAVVLSNFLQKQITPVLYHAGAVEDFKRNKLTSFLGGMKTPYKNTDQKEKGFQKMRSEYPLRTVELRVGDIKTTDFKAATKHARLMNSLSYYDTMNHMINHDLYNKDKFSPDTFYNEIVANYEKIHSAVMAGSNKNPQHSALQASITKLKRDLDGKDPAIINREIFYLIKGYTEKNFDSPEAFALSRAYEFRSNHIDANQLFKEVYEESFNRSGLFAQSKISGQTIYSKTTLHKALEKADMFALQEGSNVNTRASKIHSVLSQLDTFKAVSGEEAQEQEDEFSHSNRL
jgi:NTE family protein